MKSNSTETRLTEQNTTTISTTVATTELKQVNPETKSTEIPEFIVNESSLVQPHGFEAENTTTTTLEPEPQQ